MRILVISDLPQFVTGGAETQALRLIGAWADAGHEITCLGRRMAATEVMIGPHRIRTRRILTWQGLGRAGRAFSYVLSLGWQLLRIRRWPDVVYTRFLGDAAATVTLAKALGWIDAPLVPTPANAGKSGDISYLRSVPGSQLLISLLDRHCNAINLIAPGMEQDLRIAGFHKTKLSKIPNGIPVTPLAPMDKHGRLKVLCVGRLSEQKSYDVLISALKRLTAQQQDAIRVEIVGDGPLSLQLRNAASSLPDGLLTFCGLLSPEQVKEKLTEADLYVLPSRYEGMSNAALEAMERGLPLLLTRCHGLDTYISEEMGWVVEPGDDEALTIALCKSIEAGREILSSMGMACRRHVERNFSMAVISQRYLDLFQELMDECRGHHS